MSKLGKHLKDFGISYAASIVAGASSGVAACLFKDSVLAAIHVYHSHWYRSYWYFVILGVLIFFSQGVILWRCMNWVGFLVSVLLCGTLISLYSTMVFPMDNPLLGGILHPAYQFLLYLVSLSQFTAILLMFAVCLVIAATARVNAGNP